MDNSREEDKNLTHAQYWEKYKEFFTLCAIPKDAYVETLEGVHGESQN